MKDKIIDEIKLATCSIIVEDNGVGGLRYISDAVGGGVVIWDTSLVDMTELIHCFDHFSKYMRAKYKKEEEEDGSSHADIRGQGGDCCL